MNSASAPDSKTQRASPARADSVRGDLLRVYKKVRSTTEALCEPLEPEDMVVQTMPDVSPTKWHLAHVTWFFEKLALSRSGASYELFDERLHELFNSYYQSLGRPYPRPRRGLLSRPTVDEVRAYRRHVDEAIADLFENGSREAVERIAPVVTVGLHHEQQHQELLLMDIKHVLAQNPLRPSYQCQRERSDSSTVPKRWVEFAGGDAEVGAIGAAFTYDNEGPRHRVLLEAFELASHPVTCGEYADFIADGGYERPEFWLADGWDLARKEGWRGPLYWEDGSDGFRVMTLRGLRDIDRFEPVCHVSFYEANAYATWAGCRLPTEFEWEHAAAKRSVTGTFLESGAFHPTPCSAEEDEAGPAQLFGDVWEWTSSPYSPYPGYKPFAGELGEYNGKFMVNQIVLRGGCCVTPAGHVRRTYRNFYYPQQRWMFAGFRLAR